MAGGRHVWRGCVHGTGAWMARGTWMAGGHVWQGACVAGGMCGRGLHGRGVHGRGACMAEGGMCGRRCMAGGCACHACPPMDRMTDKCKNITLQQLRCGR